MQIGQETWILQVEIPLRS